MQEEGRARLRRGTRYICAMLVCAATCARLAEGQRRRAVWSVMLAAMQLATPHHLGLELLRAMAYGLAYVLGGVRLIFDTLARAPRLQLATVACLLGAALYSPLGDLTAVCESHADITTAHWWLATLPSVQVWHASCASGVVKSDSPDKPSTTREREL